MKDRYIRFFAECGYAGCDEEWYGKYDDGVTNSELDKKAEELGENHCAHYEYMHTQDINEDDYETLDDFEIALADAIDDYWDNMVHWGWEIISEEEFYDNADVMEG